MRRWFFLLFLLFCVCLFAESLPAESDPAASAVPPSVTPLDLLPLKKALSPLDGTEAIQSHTRLQLSGSQQGVSVTLREDLQVTARYPNRFRADVTQYDAHGGPQKKLLVVSDGAEVWTYRPGLRQYSVTPLAAWKKASSDIPALGLIVGGFYLGDGRPLVQGFTRSTLDNTAEMPAVLGSLDVSLSRQTQSVDSQDDYVYSLTLAKQDFAYQFYVTTQASRLTRVDLSGTQSSIKFFYREDISWMTPHAPLPASFFRFVPPPAAAEVPAGTFRAF